MHAKTIQIRDVPSTTYERLKLVAEREHRSLAQQALQALELGLALSECGVQRRKKLIAEWAELTPATWPENLPSPTELVRADRDR